MSHMHPPYKAQLKAENLFPPQSLPEERACSYQGDVFDTYNPYQRLSGEIMFLPPESQNIYPLWNVRDDISPFEPRDPADLYVDPLAKTAALDESDTLSSEQVAPPSKFLELLENLKISNPTNDLTEESMTDHDSTNEVHEEPAEARPSLLDLKRIDLPPLGKDE